MSRRYRGGLITANPPTPTGPYQNGAASGSWTLTQQMQVLSSGLWPIAGNVASFIGTLGGSGDQSGNGVAVSPSGDIFIASAVGGSNFGAGLAKYSASGVIQWQKLLGTGSANVWNSVAVDSSGNAYVCGTSNPSGTTDFEVAKYDASGSVQWQRYLNYYSQGADVARSIAVDSSGNVYVCGEVFDASSYKVGLITKYNSSGVLQFQTSPISYSYNVTLRGIAVDSSGNIYVCGLLSSSQGFVIKYNSSGVQQWLRGGYALGALYSVTTDASGNVYVAGQGQYSNLMSITKLDASGSVTWCKTLASTYGGARAYGIALDASGNVYACGSSDVSGTNEDAHIVKLDSSGALQWQRLLRAPGVQYDRANSIAVSGSNFVFTGVSYSGSEEIVFASLPTDGSKTGTYTVGGVSITYAASSMTFASASPSLSDLGFSSADYAVPAATSSLTASNSTLTSSVTTL